ncbi:MAG: HD domain-containing protein [Bacteroidales bacterium]|jgi:guanosine-3',5'-bis(diphosphate) 3'-pyrophosphohydrolase|nr:HD domain-containing protein [Bacteroidales bacterium]
MGETNATLIRAMAFAAERHKYQLRKGVGRIPYINHPVQVAQMLSRCGETDTDLLVAALLHDVIEDTTTNDLEIKGLSEIILQEFGEVVLLTVLEVSDNKSLPVEERKRLQVIHTPDLSDRAKKLKIADKLSNILDLKNDPPENWPLQRKMDYLAWAREVVAGARGLNSELDRRFDEAYEEVYHHLKQMGDDSLPD